MHVDSADRIAPDSIRLSGIEVFAHHGVFESEREHGQRFVIDLVLWLDLRPAATSDELSRTVHYGELAEAVVAAAQAEPVDLIETLAERIAALTLGFPAVQRVQVTVHKPEAPITVPFADVSVRITRSSAELQ